MQTRIADEASVALIGAEHEDEVRAAIERPLGVRGVSSFALPRAGAAGGRA